MHDSLKSLISEHLSGSAKSVALEFCDFLQENKLEFYRDTGYWKNKIYFHIRFRGECVCFIAIRDPDEPENLWTVWSEDCPAYETSAVDDAIKATAWSHVDFCGNCGSCAGGRQKIIFGKPFDRVCGCTFRVDNPSQDQLPFLKTMVEIRRKEILSYTES